MQNKKRLGILTLSALSALALIPFSTQAIAQNMDAEISANVGLVSQYSFRGMTQSDENVALQGGFDVNHASGWHAGVWGSNVDFNDGDEASVEVDLYGGYAGEASGISYDLGVIYYAYPGAGSSLDYDFWEGFLTLGHDFESFSVSASANYSPEYFAGSGDALYYALRADAPLAEGFTVSGHVGRQEIDNNTSFGAPDYTDWSIGLGYMIEGFNLSLQYVDTDMDEPSECADGCDARVIVGVSRDF